MKRAVVVLTILIVVVPSFAWNATGHKAIALIAYKQLTIATRARVDQLLSQHPDYSTWVEGVPATDRGRRAFLAASIWPDQIRADARFHDDDRRATTDIPGLPAGSQARHAGWHYTDIPFSPDATRTQPGEVPNIVIKLQDLEGLGAMPDSMKVYVLPWLIHLVGDIHQPLHALARFTRVSPEGDRGGNAVLLQSGNLHSYWDSRIGTGESDEFLSQVAALIAKRNPKPKRLAMNPAQWAKESFDLRTRVYDFRGAGTVQSPALLSDMYSTKAQRTAYDRAALAGYRLAEFLNQKLP